MILSFCCPLNQLKANVNPNECPENLAFEQRSSLYCVFKACFQLLLIYASFFYCDVNAIYAAFYAYSRVCFIFTYPLL